MTLNTERYRGQWWLADERAEPAPGVLTIDSDGIFSLELSGALGGQRLRKTVTQFARTQHRVVGELEDCTSVSLEGCFLRNDQSFSQIPSQLWHVHEAVFGVAFSAEEPWAFYGARLWLPGLTRWVQWNSTEPIEEFNEDGSARRVGISASLSIWPLWKVGELAVDLAVRAGTHRRNETTTELESAVLLRVRSSQLFTRRELHDVAIRPLQTVLGLATGDYTSAVRAEVTAAGATPEERFSRLPWRWTPVKGNLDPERARYGFTYRDLSARGEEVLATTMQRLDSIAPVLDLYLASLRELGYAEFSFNVVAQALETYHRCRCQGQLLPSDQWTALREQLHAVIDQTLLPQGLKTAQRALVQRLEYFNELGLRQRLRELLDVVGGNAVTVCGGDIKGFVNAVVETRNYYTHWNASLRERALRGGAAVYLTSRMRALLEILLLRELGFAPDSLAERDVLQRRVSWLPKQE